MSSRMSGSSGESLPLGRCGDRTPLRSLGNEMLNPSTLSARFNPKSLLNDGVKTRKGDDPSCDQEPSALGDVTFKSFICPGGEVEITGSSLCEEESIILPKDQAMKITLETEDTVMSDSFISQSCSSHMEHPYYIPEMEDASLVNTDAISNATLASDDIEDKDSTQCPQGFHDGCLEKMDVTWKSFVCDGGEVEVSDAMRPQDETIPLPEDQLGEPVQDNTVNSTISSEGYQLSEVEDADHLYCIKKEVAFAITTLSENTSGLENFENGLSDVTLKSFNCTGGEIEILDGTKRVDETIPLPAEQRATCSDAYKEDIDLSILDVEEAVPNGKGCFDHPYCTIKKDMTALSDDPASLDSLAFSCGAVDEVKQTCLVVPDIQNAGEDSLACGSFISAKCEAEISNDTPMSQSRSPLLDNEVVICQPPDVNRVHTFLAECQVQLDNKMDQHEDDNTDPQAISTSSLTSTTLRALNNKSPCQMQETTKNDSMHPGDILLSSSLHRSESSHCTGPKGTIETPSPAGVHIGNVSEAQLSNGPHEQSEAKDSALASSGSVSIVCNSTEKPPAENFSDVLKALSECPSVASALQFGILSPVVRRASLFIAQAQKDGGLEQFLSDDSALEAEKSLLAPCNINPTGLWAENLESPMPRPLLNSTVLGCKPQQGPLTEPLKDVVAKPCPVPESEAEEQVLGIPLIPDGPLQQQLRQMAEFLFLASGKMGPTAVSAPVPPPVAVTPPAELHSVCVGTSPMKWADHSVNTSGQFERMREFSVADSCTLTDPLLWNVPPGSLECLPRQELEQRLRSSMIMVEALVQQLSAASAHRCPSAGAAPSDLREKLVQTDHTELSQTAMHRDLYLEALSRIDELELDASSLQNLIQRMQGMRVTMTSLSGDTNTALSTMKQIGDIVSEDHQNLILHYGQMKSVFEKTKKTQTLMMQKVKDALHQRDDMKLQMEEAFTAKEAAFSAMEQLRTHCATEMADMEKAVGSQQELQAALDQTYPEQLALNKAYTEMLDSATGVLSKTMEEQSSLMQELGTVRGLLQKTAPMLLKLNEKAAAALKERDEHISARNQALEERDQIVEECNEANLSLQSAREQIGDLNLQVTILTTEMGVLRQKLTEREEERGQLDRKVTELSATVSSTLASYTFLEQALAAETTKLQQSWKDIQLAQGRADQFEALHTQSEQRVCELSQALAQSEEQLGQLQVLSQSQSLQIQQLQDICTQLSGVREMNEFLQMENELAREQMAESERLLRTNLQGLRERNIQCEDLKGELGQLQSENMSLHQELETTRSKASEAKLEFDEKLAQAVTEITLLHHTLRGLTNELHSSLNKQIQEPQKDKECQPGLTVERRHPSSSFVDSVMVALTTEQEEEVNAETQPDVAEPHCETLFSEVSAFTRITAVTPKKSRVELEPEQEEQSNLSEMFTDLGSTVTELINNLTLLRQRKDTQLEELSNTICSLQGEQEAAKSRHKAEVFELKHQLNRLNSLVEKGSQALQQKAQDEKTVTMLMSDLQETQEILNKHKTDTNDLRKEVSELRRALHLAKVAEAACKSANPASFMEEKIQLLKEVERLKLSLNEAEQARIKLLERAKRHQMIHQTNQLKSEEELQILNHMINRVRKTLLSLPDLVKKYEQLQQLVEYIG